MTAAVTKANTGATQQAKAAEQPTNPDAKKTLELKDSGGRVPTKDATLTNNGDGTATLKGKDTEFKYTGVKETKDGGFTATGGDGVVNGKQAWAKANGKGNVLEVAAKNGGEFKVDGWFKDAHGKHIGDIHTTGKEVKTQDPAKPFDIDLKDSGGRVPTKDGNIRYNGDGTATLTGKDTNFKYTGVKLREDGGFTATGGDGVINGKQAWAKQNGNGDALIVAKQNNGHFKVDGWFKDASGKHIGDIHTTGEKKHVVEPEKPFTIDLKDSGGRAPTKDAKLTFNGDGTATLKGDKTDFTYTGVQRTADGGFTATGGDGTINGGTPAWAKQNGNGHALVVKKQGDGSFKVDGWFKDAQGKHIGDVHTTGEKVPHPAPEKPFKIDLKDSGGRVPTKDATLTFNADGTATLKGENTNFTYTGVQRTADGGFTATGGDGTINGGTPAWAKQNGNGHALVVKKQDDGSFKVDGWFKDADGKHIGDIHTTGEKKEHNPNHVVDEKFGFTYDKETGKILDGEYKGYNYIRGTDGNDRLEGTDGKDFIYAGDGNDTIWGKGGDDVIFGGKGNDKIYGGKGNDVINGGAGHDRIQGGNGKDTIDGGKGNDKIWGGAGHDTIRGGAGHDRINGGNGNDTIQGGKGNDKIWGGNGNDTIGGGAGHDRIRGGKGNDTIHGGTGHDRIQGGKGKDTIDGGKGNDKIWGGAGHDTIRGGAGHDRMNGGNGNDDINGGKGNDKIWGGAGHDTIRGGAGHDRIRGGKGNDKIFGNSGNDKLFGGFGNDTIRGGQGHDKIKGGPGHDDIQQGGSKKPFLAPGTYKYDLSGLERNGFEIKNATLTLEVGENGKIISANIFSDPVPGAIDDEFSLNFSGGRIRPDGTISLTGASGGSFGFQVTGGNLEFNLNGNKPATGKIEGTSFTGEKFVDHLGGTPELNRNNPELRYGGFNINSHEPDSKMYNINGQWYSLGFIRDQVEFLNKNHPYNGPVTHDYRDAGWGAGSGTGLRLIENHLENNFPWGEPGLYRPQPFTPPNVWDRPTLPWLNFNPWTWLRNQ
ncbi:MAG: hypothetical protein MRY59_00690 [Aquisalinus sp.]|nr:hypothetical protein [Aquisalinus sp.]